MDLDDTLAKRSPPSPLQSARMADLSSPAETKEEFPVGDVNQRSQVKPGEVLKNGMTPPFPPSEEGTKSSSAGDPPPVLLNVAQVDEDAESLLRKLPEQLRYKTPSWQLKRPVTPPAPLFFEEYEQLKQSYPSPKSLQSQHTFPNEFMLRQLSTERIQVAAMAQTPAKSSQRQKHLKYIAFLRDKYKDEPQVFNKFNAIIREFENGDCINVPEIVSRLTPLLRGRPELISCLNEFFPTDVRLPVTDYGNASNSSSAPVQTNSDEVLLSNSSLPVSQPKDGKEVPLASKSSPLASPPQSCLEEKEEDSYVCHHDSEFSRSLAWLAQLKKKFGPEKHNEFLKAVHHYRWEWSKSEAADFKYLIRELYDKASVLFGSKDDWLNELRLFISLPEVPVGLYQKIPSMAGGGGEHKSSTPISKSPAVASRGRKKKGPKTPITSSTSASEDVCAEGNHFVELGAKDAKLVKKIGKILSNRLQEKDFPRFMTLYRDNLLSKAQLLKIVEPHLGGHPVLLGRFRGMLEVPAKIRSKVSLGDGVDDENKIDFSTCKRIGSYTEFPEGYIPPKCSGRTELCYSVLNDHLASNPDGDESNTVTISHHRYRMIRCEKERFALDFAIQLNRSTMRDLQEVQRKMERMSQEELNAYQLDDRLGGRSTSINQRAIKRLYGGQAPEIIKRLKQNPKKSVTRVLARLRKKDAEWSDAQKSMNRVWQDRVYKSHVRAVDDVGLTLRNRDLRLISANKLIGDLYEDGFQMACPGASRQRVIKFTYSSIFNDATELLIHYIHLHRDRYKKEEIVKMEEVLNTFLPELFYLPRSQFSSSSNIRGRPRTPKRLQEDSEAPQLVGDYYSNSCLSQTSEIPPAAPPEASSASSRHEENIVVALDPEDMKDITPELLENSWVRHPDMREKYRIFYGDGAWYKFLRLHQLICSRLSSLKDVAATLSEEYKTARALNKFETSVILGLKPYRNVQKSYSHLLKMIKLHLESFLDSEGYQDLLREVFGIHGHLAFSMDSLISAAVRLLHPIANDSRCLVSRRIFEFAEGRGATGGQVMSAMERTTEEVAYQRMACRLWAEDLCIKIIIFPGTGEMRWELVLGDDDEEEGDGGGVAGEKGEEFETPRQLRFMMRNRNSENSEEGREPASKKSRVDKDLELTPTPDKSDDH